MQTDPKRGLGRSPNGGLGGQRPPTAKPSNNFTFQVQLLLRSHHVYATFIKILNVHTHQYLLGIIIKCIINQKKYSCSRIQYGASNIHF